MLSLAEIAETERREIARRHLDMLESWLRRVIHFQLTAAFGAQYPTASAKDGHQVVSKKIRDNVDARFKSEPERYPRWIDAALLDDAISIVTNPRTYNTHFRAGLERAFPQGMDEAREYLSRVRNHRNALMHGGTCSVRMLEQCVCYSNDVVESLREHFVVVRKQRQFDAPTFTRFVDGLGNVFHISSQDDRSETIFDARKGAKGKALVGDVLTFTIEVEESYPPDTYDIQWQAFSGGQSADGHTFMVTFEDKNVSAKEEIRATLKTRESWHRHGQHDDFFIATYTVLPRE